MKRWLVRFMMAALVILCAGAGWMEIKSYREISQLRIARWSNTKVAADVVEARAWYGYIKSSNGKIAMMTLSMEGRWSGEVREEVLKDSDGRTQYSWEWNEGLATPRKPEWMMVPRNYGNRVEFLGFSSGRLERHGSYYIGRAPNEVSVIGLVLVPWPAVIVVMGIVPVWWVLRRMAHLRRRTKWTSMGRCGECGYDLRGSDDQCPECGKGSSRISSGSIGKIVA